jgi:hypothetical protein
MIYKTSGQMGKMFATAAKERQAAWREDFIRSHPEADENSVRYQNMIWRGSLKMEAAKEIIIQVPLSDSEGVRYDREKIAMLVKNLKDLYLEDSGKPPV